MSKHYADFDFPYKNAIFCVTTLDLFHPKKSSFPSQSMLFVQSDFLKSF